jgi:hypothetical protein
VEMVGGPRKVRFQLDSGAPQAELVLTDKGSGASDRVVIRRTR